MKGTCVMKLKVEPKDFFLFVLYCILLFYLCAIAVLNFSSLSTDGKNKDSNNDEDIEIL